MKESARLARREPRSKARDGAEVVTAAHSGAGPLETCADERLREGAPRLKHLEYTSLVRCLLSLVSLLSIYLLRGRAWPWAAALQAVHTGWCLFHLATGRSPARPRPTLNAQQLRLDILTYAALLMLCGLENGVLLLALLLSILLLSFRKGIKEGVVCAAAAGAVVTAGLVFLNRGGVSQLQVITALTVITLGVGLACWGGAELRNNRWAMLLGELSLAANPRFGVERTIGLLTHRLREFFEADVCLYVHRTDEGRARIYRSDRGKANDDSHYDVLCEAVARRLLEEAEAEQFVFRRGARRWPRLWRREDALYAPRRAGGPAPRVREVAEDVAEQLGAESLVCVALNFCFAGKGRLFVVNKRGRPFSRYDLESLSAVVESMRPKIENIHLVNGLASGAADRERKKIARDLHDTTVQPFIGMMLGLTALQQKLGSDSEGARELADRLLKSAEAELHEVRGYVRNLRSQEAANYRLIPALRRMLKKFSDSSGISAQLHAADDLQLNDGLAAEVFQLVAEGLSNVRRHASSARRVEVSLAARDGVLSLRIENDKSPAIDGHRFSPASISERAEALGGSLRVDSEEPSRTKIDITIPL